VNEAECTWDKLYIDRKKFKKHDRRTLLYKAVSRFGGTQSSRPSGRIKPNILARKPRGRDRITVTKKIELHHNMNQKDEFLLNTSWTGLIFTYNKEGSRLSPST